MRCGLVFCLGGTACGQAGGLSAGAARPAGKQVVLAAGSWLVKLGFAGWLVSWVGPVASCGAELGLSPRWHCLWASSWLGRAGGPWARLAWTGTGRLQLAGASCAGQVNWSAGQDKRLVGAWSGFTVWAELAAGSWWLSSISKRSFINI